MRYGLAIVLGILCLGQLYAVHAGPVSIPQTLTPMGQGIVVQVRDPLILELQDGRKIRLADIWAAAPDDPRPRVQALRQSVLDELRDRLVGQTVRLYSDGHGQNRSGQWQAHVVGPGGQWIQHDLVASGLAITWRYDQAGANVLPILHAVEDEARSATRNLWQSAAQVYWKAEDLEASYRARENPLPIGYFVVVEGEIAGDRKVRRLRWLNTTTNWKADFTVLLKEQARRQANVLWPEGLVGQHFMVRGVLQAYGGPMIAPPRLDHLRVEGDPNSE